MARAFEHPERPRERSAQLRLLGLEGIRVYDKRKLHYRESASFVVHYRGRAFEAPDYRHA